jgi:vacuolar-type H+-ATPase subunit H
MPDEPLPRQPYTGFEVVRRGYDQAQVDEHLRRLDAEIRILETDRDAAVDQSMQLNRELDDSRARAERLRAQVRTLVSPQQSVQGMSERMRSMLRLAEDEVAEMLMRAETEVNKRVSEADQRANRLLADARTEADEIRRTASDDAELTRRECDARRAELAVEARSHAERLAAEADRSQQELAAARAALADERRAHAEALAARSAEVDQEIVEARARLEADRRAHQEAVDAADAAADRRRTEAWVESEAKRALVEEDFQIAMDQRRSEALTALREEQDETRHATEEMREAARADAAAITAAAEARADEIVGEAERRVAAAHDLRAALVDELGGSRSRLDAVIESLRDAPRLASGRPATPSAADPSPAADPWSPGPGSGPAGWDAADTPPMGGPVVGAATGDGSAGTPDDVPAGRTTRPSPTPRAHPGPDGSSA